MKLFYNSHIFKLRNVDWKIDHHKIVDSLNTARGDKVIVRATQGDQDKKELDLSENDLDRSFSQIGIDLDASFDMEIVIRTPLPHTAVESALLGEHTYEDKNDYNTLQWNGERGTGNLPSHPARGCPMFFRDNGMNLDLIDLYHGRSVFLILNGPSFANVDHGKLRQPGILTFGINNGAHLFRPDLWTCVDDPTRFVESIWDDPKIMKFVPLAHFRKPVWDVEANLVSRKVVADFPNVAGFRRNEQFIASQWLREDTINWGNHGKRGGGRSVMLSALKICYLLGFRRVYLLGCDFRMSEDHRYWFPEERSGNAVSNNTKSYQIMRGYFTELLPFFGEAGFEVYNCTEGSQLDVFPFLPLDTALCDSVVDTSASTEGMYVNRYKQTGDGVKTNSLAQPVNSEDRELANAIQSSLLSTVRNAEINDKPFFHLTFGNCFPDSIFRDIHTNLPDSSAYEDLRHKDALRSDGTSARRHLILTPEKIAALPDKQASFWNGFYYALKSNETKEAVFTAHAPALSARFGEDLPNLKVTPRISLLRDEAGYKIGVHTDISKKVITTQFYLPVNNDKLHLGTSFYSKNEDGQYRMDKRMDFRENSGYSFTVNDHSFHGVDPLEESDAPRHSLLLVYYLS
ncbi:MAG: hypothetical protein P1V20_16755 [Verrucomicrobiales bacterium]|nr:hypothetical protein [Verrucomicrobiales bacterium]